MSIEIKKGDQITAVWGAGHPEQQGKISKINEDGSYIVKLRNGRIFEQHLVLKKEFLSDYFLKCSIGYHHMPSAKKIAEANYDKLFNTEDYSGMNVEDVERSSPHIN